MTARRGGRVSARAMIAFLRHHRAFCLVLAAAAALRLPALGWLPSPAGDEGNWTRYGLELLQGRPVALAPDAAFVSLLYARLIAASMAVFGPGFLAARLVGGLAVVATIVAAYVVLRRVGSPRAGLALAALLAVHPWSVLYSRICSVPYALALAVVTTGPLLFAAGLRLRRTAWVAAGILVTSLGGHLSPLTVVAAVSCAAVAVLPPNRWVFQHWATYAAAALGVLHVLPVLRSALALAEAAPELRQYDTLATRVGSYLHMVGTGLAGEATLRHFTSVALPWSWAMVPAVPAVVLVALAARRETRTGSVLGGFGPLYFSVAFVLVPLILAPGRNWYMPYNHFDRYLFAILPGFALCVAEVAAVPARWARLLALGLLAWLSLGTIRAADAFLRRGGVDHGEFVFDGGGGYRGWLVSDRPEATLEQVRDLVLQEVGPGGAAVLVADRVFIPLTFVLEGTGIPVFDVRRAGIPKRPDGRYFVLLWPDEVLSVGSPPTAPPKYVESNQALRSRMERLFTKLTLVRRFVQRDGSPLLDLWRAEAPRGRLAAEAS